MRAKKYSFNDLPPCGRIQQIAIFSQNHITFIVVVIIPRQTLGQLGNHVLFRTYSGGILLCMKTALCSNSMIRFRKR